MIVEKVGSYNPPPLCPYQHVYSTCVYLKKITISVLKYKPISQPYRQGQGRVFVWTLTVWSLNDFRPEKPRQDSTTLKMIVYYVHRVSQKKTRVSLKFESQYFQKKNSHNLQYGHYFYPLRKSDCLFWKTCSIQAKYMVFPNHCLRRSPCQIAFLG